MSILLPVCRRPFGGGASRMERTLRVPAKESAKSRQDVREVLRGYDPGENSGRQKQRYGN